jgi:hypothetical protein
MLGLGTTKRKAPKSIHRVIIQLGRTHASLQFLTLVLLVLLLVLLLVSSPVLLKRVVVAATANATASTAAAAVGVMLPVTLRQHASFKKIVALLLPAPALTIAKVVEVAAGGEIGGAQVDLQAVSPAPVVSRLLGIVKGKGQGEVNVSLYLTS